MPNVTDYTSLLTGSYWNGIEVAGQPAFVTYSFDSTAPASDAKTLSASAYATFRPFTATEQSQAQAALSEWSANSGVVFLQAAPGKGDVNFAAYNFTGDPNYGSAGGIGFYPWGNWNYSTFPHFSEDQAGAGNILMNTAFETGGQFTYVTLLHEIGHALGLKHPDQPWTDSATNPPTVHNVWDPSQPLPSSVMNEGATTLTHLTAFDIQGIQSVYGTAAQQGSQDASWSWDLNSQTLTQTMSNAATDFTRGISTNNVIMCGTGTDIAAAIGAGTNTVTAGSGSDTLIGGSGTNRLIGGSGPDTLIAGTGPSDLVAGSGADAFIGWFSPTTAAADYSAAPAGVTVDLANPSLDKGWAAGDTFNQVHNVIAPNFASTLIGDNSGDILRGGAGNDVIKGGAGNNTLIGGFGADTLTGGPGANTFVYTQLADLTVAKSGRDTITDFNSAHGDKIDLSMIATQTGTTLSFIGAGPFTGVAGQVEAVASGKNTLVQLDLHGNKKPDFAILLKGHPTLTASSFVLLPHPASFLTFGGGSAGGARHGPHHSVPSVTLAFHDYTSWHG